MSAGGARALCRSGHGPGRWGRWPDAAARLLRDDRGAEGLEKLLIIAFIVLPLLALLIFFRNDIREWLQESWNEVKDEAEDFNPDL